MNRPLILMANQPPSREVNYCHLLATVPVPANGHTPGTQSSERWGLPGDTRQHPYPWVLTTLLSHSWLGI